MNNPMIKMEMIKEGRNMRLPVVLIFYNAILSFALILFMLFNSEIFQEGYFYDTSLYQYQFIIISAIQVLAIIFLVPITVGNIYSADRSRNMIEQYMIIPDAGKQLLVARIILILAVYSLIFISGLPLISICCIYTGTSWIMILRLYIVIFVIAFWSGAIALFFYSVSRRSAWAFAGIVLTECGFFIGTILIAEMLKNLSVSLSADASVPPEVSLICMAVLLLNPLMTFLGFYMNLTANAGIATAFFEQLGIDASSRTFSYTYYKSSYVVCVLVGILFLIAAHRKSTENLLKTAR